MSDLGISQNTIIMLKGFYTGACYTWDSDVPFIPIDATVDVCGTAVYKLSKNISNEEFVNRLNNVLNNRKSYLDFANKYLPSEVLEKMSRDYLWQIKTTICKNKIWRF